MAYVGATKGHSGVKSAQGEWRIRKQPAEQPCHLDPGTHHTAARVLPLPPPSPSLPQQGPLWGRVTLLFTHSGCEW